MDSSRRVERFAPIGDTGSGVVRASGFVLNPSANGELVAAFGLWSDDDCAGEALLVDKLVISLEGVYNRSPSLSAPPPVTFEVRVGTIHAVDSVATGVWQANDFTAPGWLLTVRGNAFQVVEVWASTPVQAGNQGVKFDLCASLCDSGADGAYVVTKSASVF